MGRAKVDINKTDLVKVITVVEKDGPLENRSVLIGLLAKEFDVSIATISNRLKEFDLFNSLKTPKGKRGFSPSSKPTKSGETAEVNVCSDKKEAIAQLRRYMGKKLGKLVNRVEQGSKVAAIKLKCIECCGGLQPDKNGAFVKIPVNFIRNCGLKDCALYTLRPYQLTPNENDSIETD